MQLLFESRLVEGIRFTKQKGKNKNILGICNSLERKEAQSLACLLQSGQDKWTEFFFAF